MARQRSQTRQSLLEATEQEFAKIVKATQPLRKPLKGKDEIALRVGQVMNRFKVAKHFQLTMSETHFSYQRKEASICSESNLDGIYILRTTYLHHILDGVIHQKLQSCCEAAETPMLNREAVFLELRQAASHTLILHSVSSCS
ncbi:MAG: hypothetical protein HC769_13880 [Cyanobacteria bacterium CRU_2_1]|nr:hypothetical protein [Cyanobacteria bacterium RU_5_0]NJR59826.1 hypothetical protein [Cyanobacteria bacterium CRU_2_1]